MVCGDAESAPVALEKILAAKPDLVVIDLTLTAGTGLDVLAHAMDVALIDHLIVADRTVTSMRG